MAHNAGQINPLLIWAYNPSYVPPPPIQSMATPLATNRYYGSHQQTPHLLQPGHYYQSSSSPMVSTPVASDHHNSYAMVNPLHDGKLAPALRAVGQMGTSTASISSASSQDSNFSSQATSFHADIASISRAQSRSPIPTTSMSQDVSGLGFGYAYPQSNGIVMARVGQDGEGMTAAANAEAYAQSEKEEAASILVHSVATTPRHHRKASDMSQFEPFEHDGDLTMVRSRHLFFARETLELTFVL